MKTSKRKSRTISAGVKLTADELDTLERALDEVYKEVSDNHLPYVGTEGERKGLMHASWHELHKAMCRPRMCSYPGCTARSVRRSHAIQKGGPLQFIAEDNHVIAPEFSSDGSGFSAARVGVNEAATFPGFCEKHESLFHEFERVGQIRTDRDINLQVFRTICREIAVKQIQLAHIRSLRKTIDGRIEKKGMEILKQRLGVAFVRKHGLRSLTFNKVSKSQVGMLQSEKELGAELKRLENDFLPVSAKDLNTESGTLYHVRLTADKPLPVCLSGVAYFGVEADGKACIVPVILNVLPTPRETLISASTLAVHQHYLEAYIQHMLERIIGPLVMVETWIVRGPAHWFMAPSAWQNIPQSRRARILADMADDSIGIGQIYTESILDSVRESALKDPKAVAEPREIYEAEMAKLADRV